MEQVDNIIWTPERQQSARDTCALFAGTPHRNRMAHPGRNGGVDCIHFVDEILMRAGVVPKHRLPSYDERYGIFRERNVIEDIILSFATGISLPSDTVPEFGDIVICSVGKQSNHVGIVIDGVMWHVRGGGHCGYEAVAVWAGRIQSFVRITATGLRRDPADLRADELRIAPAAASE